MAIKYSPAPDVEELAHKIIQQFHKHLVEAKIQYLYREGASWTKSGKDVLGQTKRVSGAAASVTGLDFMIIINQSIWAQLPQNMKEAVIDHELAHCCRGEDDKEGNPKWSLQSHDVEEFVSIGRRHGSWSTEIDVFISNLKKNNLEEKQQVEKK